MAKDLWVDTETADLFGDIIQLSIKVDREAYNWFIKPRGLITEMATKKHGITNEMAQDFPPANEVIKSVREVLEKHNPSTQVKWGNKEDKYTFCGYNVTYDMEVLKNFFDDYSVKSIFQYFSFYYRDVYHRAMEMWIDNESEFRDLENLELGTLCKKYGITIEEHNSASDIQATRFLWEVIKK